MGGRGWRGGGREGIEGRERREMGGRESKGR